MDDEFPRTPFADLITEYQLHDDRKHIYVEGREDQSILSWYLREALPEKVVEIIDIDEVAIGAELLQQHGLDNGKRGRVIAFSRELDKELSAGSANVLCIADADFDYVLEAVETSRFLAVTDGTSMEMYAFSESALRRVLHLGLRELQLSPGDVLHRISAALSEVFLVRATNAYLKLGLTWLAFERRCKVRSDGELLFDVDRFVRAYLSKNSMVNWQSEFLKTRDLLAHRTCRTTQRIHGHDFGALLTTYLRNAVKSNFARNLAKGQNIIRMLHSAISISELRETPLFQRITQFASGIPSTKL